MTPEKFFEKGAWPGSRDPLFYGLNSNSSKMAKFGMHAPRDSPDRMPEKLFSNGAWPSSIPYIVGV